MGNNNTTRNNINMADEEAKVDGLNIDGISEDEFYRSDTRAITHADI